MPWCMVLGSSGCFLPVLVPWVIYYRLGRICDSSNGLNQLQYIQRAVPYSNWHLDNMSVINKNLEKG